MSQIKLNLKKNTAYIIGHVINGYVKNHKWIVDGWSLGKFGLEYFPWARKFHALHPTKQSCVSVEKCRFQFKIILNRKGRMKGVNHAKKKEESQNSLLTSFSFVDWAKGNSPGISLGKQKS